ncbi:S-adenosylmethionine sensor upstream of mTORC1-like [Ptychodera flava]|uniref:S-adenosylmethionine sensor upstream of mTORC1-like n=1 Tax=Ptychodera flava TaxID=63121 RepID=UPI003969F0B6
MQHPDSCSHDRGCHDRASGVVKQVHQNLRRKFKEAKGDFAKVWHEHCEDEDTLEEYACAMQHLAIQHWTGQPEDRIEWCRNCCSEFFFCGGLKKALDKDERTRLFNMKKSGDDTVEAMLPKGKYHEHESPKDLFLAGNEITLPFSGKIRLLDVGSCYNPFVQFDEFLAVGIDISPAVDTVHKCDFLNLQLNPPLQLASDSVNTFLRNLNDPIDTLPKECFHVVVFSLLLSYFPSPYQRWICCQKANQLLQKNGLLLIITPDSSHQNKHTSMMKSWRRAIESMGFKRWKYVKYMHMHFLAFRKVSSAESSLIMGDANPEMLYIPQDFHDTAEECIFTDAFSRQSDSDDQSIKDAFSELPNSTDEEETLSWN